MSNSQSNYPGNRRLPPMPIQPATSAPGPPTYLPPFPATSAPGPPTYLPPFPAITAASRPSAYTSPNAASRSSAYTSPHAASGSSAYTSPYAASGSSAYTSPHAASGSSAYPSPYAASGSSGSSAYTTPYAASRSSAYTTPYTTSGSSAYTAPYAASGSSANTAPYAASGSSANTAPYAASGSSANTSQYVPAPQSANPFPNLRLIAPSLLYSRWDSQADAITMTGHRLGETTLEISKRLIAAGYSATRNEVAANLQKQGVKDVNWGNVANSRGWDAQADSFVMAAHRTGKTRAEMLRLLHQRGYSSSISTVEITASLHKQETMERSRRREVPILAGERAWWDPKADSLVLAAYREGKTIEEISQQLTATGMPATKIQVLTSLENQGVEDATWGGHSAGKKRPS